MNFQGCINLDKIIPSCLVISRYSEDFSWAEEYTHMFLILNRGEEIHDYREGWKILNVPNVGGNQKDIFEYIYDNYNSLDKLTAFVQGYPFDHCKKEIFDKLIYNDYFTPLEYYGSNPANAFENRSSDGGFMELNNSWYIPAHNGTYGLTCRYSSFDEFMYKYFKNYQHMDWIRFTPGSQYIVEKNQIIKYPRKFWKYLSNELQGLRPTEGHIIERALYTIFTGNLELREEFYD